MSLDNGQPWLPSEVFKFTLDVIQLLHKQIVNMFTSFHNEDFDLLALRQQVKSI
jgi:hypothetical protein